MKRFSWELKITDDLLFGMINENSVFGSCG